MIYGLVSLDRDEYLEVERVGRRKPVAKGDAGPRGPIWDSLMSVDATFTHRWIDVYRKYRTLIDQGETITDDAGRPFFTHVFIDECQDLTPADFRIAAALAPSADTLTVGGDESQSMHLSSSYRRPSVIRGRRWQRWDLTESYRLS